MSVVKKDSTELKIAETILSQRDVKQKKLVTSDVLFFSDPDLGDACGHLPALRGPHHRSQRRSRDRNGPIRGAAGEQRRVR